MRLVGYVRVSEESENPENQRYAIFQFCAKHGHQLVDTLEDIGVSGALPPRDRPAFSKLLKALDQVDFQFYFRYSALLSSASLATIDNFQFYFRYS